jgi:hypothetical protein
VPARHNNRLQSRPRSRLFSVQIPHESLGKRGKGRVIRENGNSKSSLESELMGEEKPKNQGSDRSNLDSKNLRLLLVVLAAVLTFGGPYSAYILINLIGLSQAISVATGFVLFAVGMILIWYLIRKKVIS